MTNKTSAPERLDVQILDRSYQLSCTPEDKPVLLECVSLVDARMRQVKSTGKLQGLDRIAVMAALTLARDLLNSGAATGSNEKEEMLKKISVMTQAVETALTPQEKLF